MRNFFGELSKRLHHAQKGAETMKLWDKTFSTETAPSEQLRTLMDGADAIVVGANTPGIIKYPFWRMTAANKNACYVSINPAQQLVPDAIAGRALSFACGVDAVI